MYTILINDDNTLTTTQKERIMKKSKLVDKLVFFVRPMYKGYPMSDGTVLMEYILPISGAYRTITLKKSEDMHGEFLQYTVPFDTDLTSENGDIRFKLTFALADIDEDGKQIQRVRKTDTGIITIVPTDAWSDIIPDSALDALDQRIIKQDAQIKELLEIGEMINDTKADNLRYNSKSCELQLVSGGKAIGNKVIIAHSDNSGEDSDWPVVEF